MLKCKLHRACVTECDLDYNGSISIDAELMERAGLFAHEQVDVLNINNGARFTTYVIEAERGSGKIGINGAAARLAVTGDRVIICAYGSLPAEQARNYAPEVVLLDKTNKILKNT